MIGVIIIFIAVPICSYWIGYYGSKINTLKEFKTVMEQIHDKAMDSDFSDDYQFGYACGLIHAIDMIQNSNMF